VNDGCEHFSIAWPGVNEPSLEAYWQRWRRGGGSGNYALHEAIPLATSPL